MSWFRYAQVGSLWTDWQGASASQEQLAVDLDAPVAAQWVELKRAIVAIADELGIGAEVSAGFDALKLKAGVEIAAGAAGTAGGTAGLGIAAGVSTGVVGGVVLAAFAIFGGGDDGPTVAKLRRDKIRAVAWQQLTPPTFSSLAAEQDAAAATSSGKAKAMAAVGADPHVFEVAASASKKLGAFYRLASDTLSSSEKKLFLAVVFLARLVAFKNYLAQLDASVGSGFGFFSARQEVYTAFPNLDQELASRIAVADKQLAAASKKTTPKRDSGLLASLATLAVPLAVGAGALYWYKPALAKRIAGGAASGVKTVATGAAAGVTKIAQKVGG